MPRKKQEKQPSEEKQQSPKKKESEKNKSPKEKYEILNDVEQILLRPDMYMGSIRNTDTSLYVFDEQSNKMICQDINFNSGLLKIFDEVITNAQDQAIRTRKDRKKTKNIYVQINKQTGVITVCNDGPSIEIKKHSKEKIYMPELVFSRLRTSENYDDSEVDRRVGGLNGYGVKLTNIYSKFLEIDIIHKGERYQQRFENNMSVINTPIIEKKKSTKDSGSTSSVRSKKGGDTSEDYVKVTFLPDYQRFGLKSLTDDMYKVMIKRTYDCAGTCSKLISTHFNGRQLKIQSFKDYCSLYLATDAQQIQIEQPKLALDKDESGKDKKYQTIKYKNKDYKQYQELRDDTQIIVTQSDGNFQQISFVNNVNTVTGGKHVDYILGQLQDKIVTTLKNKRGNKEINISKTYVKENICLFLNTHVYQPRFNSQAKENFSSEIQEWGYIPTIEDRYIKKIIESPIGEAIIERINQANNKPTSKTDGKKKKTLGYIDGLVDATKAGTSESNKCVLFLVEGKSAQQLIISGRSQIPNGIEYYGVFALRGKVLNVRDVAQKKIDANNEITQIKQILGLQQGKVYKDTSELRYGKILIGSDQDLDGSHIASLINNLFQKLSPSLLKFEPNTFINRFLTPIIIATKKGSQEQHKDFYTQQDFDVWAQENESQIGRWKIKYFKGLAVFDQNSGKRHFKSMRLMSYHWQNNDEKCFSLAFDKKRAQDRKQWLENYKRDNILDYNSLDTTFSDQINKELIHFSVDDVARSVCSLMDGLKPSQRKILYACFKRRLWNDELRVAQLAGYCSEVSAYEHGESSLQGAIVQMAQDHVGSNNINLLLPNGQFGTRYDPKASGAPRYIHTQLNSIVKILMNQEDNAILNYKKDDENQSIEPDYYLPIIPLALVNGCIGIGTGFSTKIPNYNPLDIAHNLQVLLQQEKTRKSSRKNKLIDMVPYYRGFTGKIAILDSSVSNTEILDEEEDIEEDEQEDTAQSKNTTRDESVTDKSQNYVSTGVFERIGKSSKIKVTEIPIGRSIKSFVEYIKTTYKQPQSEIIEDINDDRFILTIDFQESSIVDNLLEKQPNKNYPRIYKDLQLKSLIHTTNMYMFNDQGQIKKYSSPLEVIQAFFRPRLIYYQKRKDYIIQQLEKDIFVLRQKAKFIMDIIKGKLDLRNKKQQVIVQELLKNDYLPLDKNNQPLTNVDNQQNYSFDFLTEMAISSYTLEKKEQLLKNLKDKEDKLEQIQNKHIADMWYEELEQLKKELLPVFKN